MLFEVPGYVCPHCGTDCSPIANGVCEHFFLTDGENGWRFTALSRSLYTKAEAVSPILFRDLLYHDAECRAHLVLRRVVYDDSLEMYVYSDSAAETERAFQQTIQQAISRQGDSP
jgi:hypothetical protein